jgi:hypothetical protein
MLSVFDPGQGWAEMKDSDDGWHETDLDGVVHLNSKD